MYAQDLQLPKMKLADVKEGNMIAVRRVIGTNHATAYAYYDLFQVFKIVMPGRRVFVQDEYGPKEVNIQKIYSPDGKIKEVQKGKFKAEQLSFIASNSKLTSELLLKIAAAPYEDVKEIYFHIKKVKEILCEIDDRSEEIENE